MAKFLLCVWNEMNREIKSQKEKDEEEQFFDLSQPWKLQNK